MWVSSYCCQLDVFWSLTSCTHVFSTSPSNYTEHMLSLAKIFFKDYFVHQILVNVCHFGICYMSHIWSANCLKFLVTSHRWLIWDCCLASRLLSTKYFESIEGKEMSEIRIIRSACRCLLSISHKQPTARKSLLSCQTYKKPGSKNNFWQKPVRILQKSQLHAYYNSESHVLQNLRISLCNR